MDQAACADALKIYGRDLFFSEDPHDRLIAKRDLCSTCPVSFDCLRFALKGVIGGGIFAGMDERELRSFAQRHRRVTVERARELHHDHLGKLRRLRRIARNRTEPTESN